MELPIMGALWSIGCGVGYGAAGVWWLLLLAVVPLGVIVVVDVVNEAKRLLWLCSFDQTTTMRKLRQRIADRPQRFQFHFTSYSGFDRLRLRSAVVVDDIEADERIAIYPGSNRVVEQLRQVGVRECRNKPG